MDGRGGRLPPGPPPGQIKGVPMQPITYHGTAPISGKITDLLRLSFAFPHNIDPLSRDIFSHLTPYLGNIMVTPIPFLVYFLFFLWAREICVRILALPSGALTTTDIKYNKESTPPPRAPSR